MLNHFQHTQDIRSNDYILAYYILSVVASAINIRTMALLHQSGQDQFKAFAAFFAINLLGFVIEALPRGRTHIQKSSNASRYSKANLISRATFQYLQPIVSKGFKTPLTNKDIDGMMPEHIKSVPSHERLSRKWQANVAKSQARGTKPSLLWTVIKSYGWSWAPIFVFCFAASTLTFVLPQLLNQLLSFIGSYQTPNPQPVALGIILSFGMFFAALLTTLCMAQYSQLILNIGIEARTGLIAMIYRKSLKLSSAAKQTSTAGEINNHMSVDAERWCDSLQYVPLIFTTPYEVALAMWMLYEQIGWSVFVGLATIIVLTPLNMFIGSFFMTVR